MRRNERGFTFWDVLLLLAAMGLLAVSAYLYFSDISLRRYVLGWQDADEARVKIGMMSATSGSVLRQVSVDIEFRSIKHNDDLYNYDTIVTGPDGHATIMLEDGSTIDLGPGSMIKLAFESKLSFDGISRAANVEVIAGNVSGQAKDAKIVLKTREGDIAIEKNRQQSIKVAAAPMVKPSARPKPVVTPVAPPGPAPEKPRPSPSPSPVVVPRPSPSPSPSPSVKPAIKQAAVKIQVLAPKAGDTFRLDNGAVVLEKAVKMQWKIQPIGTKARYILRHGTKGVLIDKPFVAEKENGTATVTLKSPGEYTFILNCEECPKERPVRVGARFVLEREYEGIEGLPPLVGGKVTDSNAYDGDQSQNFSITLRWKPVEGVEKYKIRIKDSQKATKYVLQRELEAPAYSFNKNKIYTGKAFYDITAETKSGFIATSPPLEFSFSFLPPNLVIPEDGAVVSKASFSSSDNTILITWQKTTFTQGYVFELGTDPDFKRIVISKNQKENFFVITAPSPGKYWWRVRSYSKNLSSPYSRANSLTITP
ncbi:MAG: hypothetical protein A2583_13770 [Bdellovibrionales bacterium RIFOXYD1_FULL_53_11]|nr:MAG: hypothetical protein A2583_13770 [Bdellovibrionales bacterium RIFOXYD1_FULL_53_11]